MKKIKEYVEAIDEELEGAKEYAEKYVECKAKDNMQSATKYKEMANDELKHAMYEHEWAVKKLKRYQEFTHRLLKCKKNGTKLIRNMLRKLHG